jgi:hypothetical protein
MTLTKSGRLTFVFVLALFACGKARTRGDGEVTWKEPSTQMEFVLIPAGQFKTVLRRAAGDLFSDITGVFSPYGDRGGATIDRVVGSSVAVEIDSRVAKQVRGAPLDLMCHPDPKKLLVLVPVHMSNPSLCMAQSAHILARYVKPENYRVVLLSGTGDSPALEADVIRVKRSLAELDAGLTNR